MWARCFSFHQSILQIFLIMSPQKSTLEFASWNVNGLRACRKKTFDIFIEDYNPDFLCLQEVKLNPDVIPEDEFGYAFAITIWLRRKDIPGPPYFPRKNHSQWLRVFLMENIPEREG